jgi:hypothetical protein
MTRRTSGFYTLDNVLEKLAEELWNALRLTFPEDEEDKQYQKFRDKNIEILRNRYPELNIPDVISGYI